MVPRAFRGLSERPCLIRSSSVRLSTRCELDASATCAVTYNPQDKLTSAMPVARAPSTASTKSSTLDFATRICGSDREARPGIKGKQ